MNLVHVNILVVVHNGEMPLPLLIGLRACVTRLCIFADNTLTFDCLCGLGALFIRAVPGMSAAPL